MHTATTFRLSLLALPCDQLKFTNAGNFLFKFFKQSKPRPKQLSMFNYEKITS